MTQSDPSGVHDWHSAAYVQEWIQTNERGDERGLLRRIAHLIPFEPDTPIRVLDIGGGWGPVTRVVLETFPHARVVLHDFSQPMLDAAAHRLAEFGDAVSFYRADLMDPQWAAGLDGQFDAVVSHICIHNVRFPDRIRAIYHEVFPLVAPGGAFVNLDHQAQGPLVRQAQRHAEAMARRQRIYEETGEWRPLDSAARSRSGRIPHADREPSAEDLARMAAHEPATLANQIRWLLEAGFDEADCFYLERRDALIAAFRAI